MLGSPTATPSTRQLEVVTRGGERGRGGAVRDEHAGAGARPAACVDVAELAPPQSRRSTLCGTAAEVREGGVRVGVVASEPSTGSTPRTRVRLRGMRNRGARLRGATDADSMQKPRRNTPTNAQTSTRVRSPESVFLKALRGSDRH